MSDAIFDGLSGIGQMILFAALAYVAVVLILRISGKRTLAKLNAFDLIVTVALGSTLASTILSKTTPLAEGLAAFATLVALQWLVAWSSVRFSTVARLVRSEPTLLMHKGEVLHGALLRERITQRELETVVRQSSARTLENASAVILETDGSFSVVAREGSDDGMAFAQTGLQ